MESIYHLNKGWYIYGEVTTKRKEFELLRVVSCGKVNMRGKLVENKVILVRYICSDLYWHWLSVSSDNGCFSPFVWERVGEAPSQRQVGGGQQTPSAFATT